MPTQNPTLSPTIPFSVRWPVVVSSYQTSLSKISSYQIFYTDLSRNGFHSFGGCGQWDVLLNEKLATASIAYTPIRISMSTLTSDGLLRLGNQYGNGSLIAKNMLTLQCNNASVVNAILRLLRTLATDSSFQYPFQVNFFCESVSWSVVKCSSQSFPVLCTECANYCFRSEAEQVALSSLVVSCGDPVLSVIGQLYTLFIEYTEVFPPPLIRSFDAAPTADTILVTSEFSGPGSFICGAYLRSTGYTPPSSDVLLSQGFPTVVTKVGTSYFGTYEISGLVPSSSYLLYCATRSLTSLIMSSSMSRVTVTTSCCRDIKVTLRRSTFNDRDDVLFALSVDIGSSPNSNLVVSVAVKDALNSSSVMSGAMFTPWSFTFQSITQVLVVQSTYLRSLAGSYRLVVSLAGSSSADYRASFPAGDTFVVRNTEVEPSPPILSKAIFSRDGSRVIVSFASPTNKGGVSNIQKCATMFSSRAIDFQTRCVWVDSSTLEISSTGDTGISVGDVIQLRVGTVKSACTSIADPTCKTWKSNSAQTVSVTAPSNILSPTIVVSIPSLLGSCDNLRIDLTGSTGSGGRNWKSFKLVVDGNSPNITSLQSFLDTVNDISAPITVPNSYLTAGYAYTFHVGICNFLGSCSGRGIPFIVSAATNMPVVSLNSQNLIKIYRY